MALTNYFGAQFVIEVDRTVRLLDNVEITEHLGHALVEPGVGAVAFESSNTVTNAGRASWQPESGLVSVWILGMFTASPKITIAIPFGRGLESTLGPIVNDKYFGKVPADRLHIGDGGFAATDAIAARSAFHLPEPVRLLAATMRLNAC